MERFKENILIINPGWEQENLINFCIKYFYNIYAIFFNRNDFNKKNYYFKSKIFLNYLQKRKAYNFAKDKKIRLILSDQCDYALYLQSYLTKKLNINGPTLLNGKLSYDKSKLYTFCVKKKILVPKFWIFKKILIKNLYKKFILKKKKFISKPVDNRGSIGVNIFDSSNFLRPIKNSFNNSEQKKIILQDYIIGKNIIVESTGKNIELIGFKEMSIIQKHLNNDIIFFKPNIKNLLHKKIISNHIRIVKKLNFLKGFVSAEYILNKRIWLIEITNRGGGVGISSIIKSKMLGYNSYINLLKDFFNKKINFNKLKKENKLNTSKVIYLKYILLNKKISKIYYEKIKRKFLSNKNFLYLKIWNFKNKSLNNIKNSTDRNGIAISCFPRVGQNKLILNKFLKKHLKIY